VWEYVRGWGDDYCKHNDGHQFTRCLAYGWTYEIIKKTYNFTQDTKGYSEDTNCYHYRFYGGIRDRFLETFLLAF